MKILAFIGWSYYILERLTILHAMFFFELLFSQSKGVYKTIEKHTQVKTQASIERILFAGFF